MATIATSGSAKRFTRSHPAVVTVSPEVSEDTAIIVEPLPADQLAVRPDFHHPAAVHRDDHVGVPAGCAGRTDILSMLVRAEFDNR